VFISKSLFFHLALTPTDTSAIQLSTPQNERFAILQHQSQTKTMASAFEPSLSTSRQGLPGLGPSPADNLPNINFGFDDLRDRMAKFTAKFDAFIEQGRKRVLEERNQFHMNVAELQGTE
jgi:kinetochore protein Spc25